MAIDVWRIVRTAFPGRPVPPGCVQQEDLIFCLGGTRSIGSPGPGTLAGGARANSSGGGASSGSARGGASNGGGGGDRGGGDGDSSGGNPPPSNEEDCLPRVDPRVLARLQNEGSLLRDLAGGGYMADLTLQTWGKLLAARLHHLTEPNEGIAARTVDAAQRTWEYAPQAVAEAAREVTRFASGPADNHQMLYEEAQVLEQSLRRAWARLPRDQKRLVGGLMFMELRDAVGGRYRHAINVRFLGATFEYWDDQREMDGARWFADVLSTAFFRTF